MCTTCGCSVEVDTHHHHHDGHQSHHHGEKTRRLKIEEDILAKNNAFAVENRARFLGHGIFAINLVSSPGSGKTTLLETTLKALTETIKCAVIEGDQQTDHDAQRVAATGVPVRQINTGTGCHLDAHMVGHAVEHFDLSDMELLFIENVGNLVCPAAFDLGEHHKVAVLSVTEGEDKPLKYPHIFRAVNVVLLNKIDLLPHLDFNVELCREAARRVNPKICFFELSAKTGAGMDAWYSWLKIGVTAAGGARKPATQT